MNNICNEHVLSDTDSSSSERRNYPSGGINVETSGSAPVASESKPDKKYKFPRWNSFTYTTRATISFAFIAIMTALIAIGVLSFVWEQHFQTYSKDNMEALAESTANRIEKVYESTGTLYTGEVQAIAEYAQSLSSGAGIVVVDNINHNEVYDSTRIRLEDGDELPLDTSPSLAPEWGSEGLATANIVVDGVAVGSVRVWVYGSETLVTQADEEFRNKSYQAMTFAAVLAIVLASCIGFLFARTLVRPINCMTKTAKAIKEGNLAARTNLRGEDEIAHLGETFDAMADSIERDRELERRLTTDVAHELRTPLMAIRSTVEAMIDGVFKADEERLETVNSEVQRLSRLVDAILRLSRLENRSTPLKKEIVDVGKLISGIVSTHEAFVADSGLTLFYEADPGIRVFGDADMIRQATANLISNAVRYTPEGGFITVRVKANDLMALIEVEDTGIGLTPDEAKMVFSRFWRADAGRTRESGGLGIDLTVVKEIVDRHDGWVQVEGIKDQGACFTIHIPLYKDTEQQKGQKSQKTRGKSRKDRHQSLK